MKLLLLLVAAPVFGQTVEQQKTCNTGGSTATSLNCTFDSTPTAGRAVIVTCSYYDFNNLLQATVSDNKSNSYTRHVEARQGAGTSEAASSIHSASNISSSATFTVTCTIGTATYINIAIYEVSGLAQSSMFDQSGSNVVTTNSASATATSGTTTQNNEFVIISVAFGAASTATAGTGYTLGRGLLTTNNVIAFQDAYRNVTSTGAQTGTINFSPVVSYAASIATFKASGGGAGSTMRRKAIVQ